jgi:hypothetical protein
MRILCALHDAVDKDEIDQNIPRTVAERLWKALWTEDKNTSEERIMQAELDSLLPGGWDKWKYVHFPPLSFIISLLFGDNSDVSMLGDE